MLDDRTKGLLGALGSYSQVDMDGIMCEVSRQAVEEAADLIEQQAAELERLRADAERYRESLVQILGWRELRNINDAPIIRIEGIARAAIDATRGE